MNTHLHGITNSNGIVYVKYYQCLWVLKTFFTENDGHDNIPNILLYWFSAHLYAWCIPYVPSTRVNVRQADTRA